jgi:hypothetical protein
LAAADDAAIIHGVNIKKRVMKIQSRSLQSQNLGRVCPSTHDQNQSAEFGFHLPGSPRHKLDSHMDDALSDLRLFAREEFFELWRDIGFFWNSVPIEGEANGAGPGATDMFVDLLSQGIFEKPNLLHARRTLDPNVQPASLKTDRLTNLTKSRSHDLRPKSPNLPA